MGQFKSIVYNRNFVLNIDNDTTNRNNKNYISGYYKLLSNDNVTPAQNHLTYKSLRAFDSSRTPKKHSVDVDRMLNSNSEFKPIMASPSPYNMKTLQQDSSLMQEINNVRNDQE